MPITDKDVGITELLGSHRPFRAILKQCVDDFVVNEVLLSGKVARLTRLARGAAPSSRAEKRRQPDTAGTDVDRAENGGADRKDMPVVPSDLPLDQLEANFTDASKKIASAAIVQMIESDASSLLLPVCGDKQKRKLIHDWVRNNLPAFVTDTCEREVDGEKGQAVRLRKRKACRPWKRRRTDRREDNADRVKADAINEDTYDPRENNEMRGNGHETSVYVGRNTYVQFVLWKRNKDTLEALTMLSKILRVPSNAFTFAGTKDKRAVTTQLVQVRGVAEHRLAYANNTVARRDRGQRSMAVGNVEILPSESPKSLGLGDLRGNRFTLALRDLDIETEEDRHNVCEAVESVRTRGFVDYFGLQRFGSGVSGTHETGFAFLRGDFEDVCRRILLPLRMDEWEGKGGDGIRPERQRLNDALEKFGKKEIRAKELMNALPKWMHIESTLARSFVHDEEQGRTIYDYRAAFDKLPRNLRRMYGHAVQSYLWNKMASERIRVSRPDDLSRMHAIKGDLVLVDPDSKTEVNYETQVRTVTEEEEKQKSISIFRVLIPVLGSEVSVPEEAAYGEVAKTIMAENKIDLQNRLSADYGMKGTYRSLLAQLTDVEMNIISYSNPNEILIPSAVFKLERSERDKRDSGRNVDKTPNADVSATKDNTDIKKTVNTADTPEAESHAKSEKLASDADKKPSELVELVDDTGKPEGSRKALIIAFTLGRGEFATMLVRELTRKDSSTSNQKAMQDAIRKEEGP